MNAFFYDSSDLFLKFFALGVCFGIVYDCIRIFRIGRNDTQYAVLDAIRKRYFSVAEMKKKPIFSHNWLVMVEDVFFFLVVAVAEILFIYHFNDGEIRIYGLVCSVFGFLVYNKTVGRLIIFISKKILYVIRRIIYWVLHILIAPFFAMFKIFG